MPYDLRTADEIAVVEAELAPLPAADPRAAVAVSQSMHGSVFKALAVVNAAILGVFALTFHGDAGALFMVAISGVYLASYLITPWVMTRVGHADPVEKTDLGGFLDRPVETWTGRISGREAMIQVLLVPTAILFATMGMGLIITAAAAG